MAEEMEKLPVWHGFTPLVEFKIEAAGKRITNILEMQVVIYYQCSFCSREIPDNVQALTYKEPSYHKLCRNCTKQLAKFFDDNRSAIISM